MLIAKADRHDYELMQKWLDSHSVAGSLDQTKSGYLHLSEQVVSVSGVSGVRVRT